MLLRAQKGDTAAMFDLVEKFAPALHKYAFELHYEDAYNDLVVELIAAIYRIRLANLRNRKAPAMINYIWAVIYHAYIAINKREEARTNKTVLTDDVDSIIVCENGTINDAEFDNAVIFSDFRQHLTKLEADVIYLLYYANYTVQEIANLYQVSRQAVNKTKNRALQKLRDYYSD